MCIRDSSRNVHPEISRLFTIKSNHPHDRIRYPGLVKVLRYALQLCQPLSIRWRIEGDRIITHNQPTRLGFIEQLLDDVRVRLQQLLDISQRWQRLIHQGMQRQRVVFGGLRQTGSQLAENPRYQALLGRLLLG